MRRKLWIGVLAVIATAALGLSLYAARVRVFPRLILSQSLNTALSQLEVRFEKSPVHLFRGVYNPGGYYLADLQLETGSARLGPVRYDMELQTQLAPLRISGSGTVITGGKALDLGVYLDGDFAAVSSDSLVEGYYYGITYDSFSQDIQGREVLAALIGEERISQWENSVSDLDKTMSGEFKMPEFSLGDIKTALYAILVLKPQVGRETIPVLGEETEVHTVTFRADAQQIATASEPYQQELTPEVVAWIREIREDPQFYLEAEFYLDREDLVRIDAVYFSSRGSCDICIYLGAPGEKEPLSLELEVRKGEDLNRLSVTLENSVDGQHYQEKSRLTWTRNGLQKAYGTDYTYDLSSGEMDLLLTIDGKNAQMRLNLAAEGEKITVTSQNICPFLNLFREKALEYPAICTLSLMPGQEVSVPEYKNMDLWSMDDLWMLIKGLGGLLGIKL